MIAEAADGMEAIELAEKKLPNLLLLDLALPRAHGLDVIRRICKNGRTKVLVVSMHSAETYVIEAMRNGASGYVLKQSSPADLIKAVRTVCAGGIYLSPSLSAREIMSGIKTASANSKKRPDSFSTLTRREKIVLQLAAEGNNNTQIARLLYLSPRTVESHRASLMRKLKLKSQTEIVRFAIRKNIISA